jgi:hypothetical protein
MGYYIPQTNIVVTPGDIITPQSALICYAIFVEYENNHTRPVLSVTQLDKCINLTAFGLEFLPPPTANTSAFLAVVVNVGYNEIIQTNLWQHYDYSLEAALSVLVVKSIRIVIVTSNHIHIINRINPAILNTDSLQLTDIRSVWESYPIEEQLSLY